MVSARAFLLAAETKGIEGEVIHFGQGSAVSIGDLARKCLRAAGSKAKVISVKKRLRPEKSEVGLLLCNPARARKLLGWKPEVALDIGLKRTAEYLKQHLGEYRPKDYSV